MGQLEEKETQQILFALTRANEYLSEIALTGKAPSSISKWSETQQAISNAIEIVKELELGQEKEKEPKED